MYKVERAIIMAAGYGNRMKPITLETPKPMIIVNGVRIIDTIINGLRKNGIYEIIIVVGYLKDKFKVLEKEYEGVRLVDNPYYDSCNNISSLYVARNYIENAIILDGDQIIYNTEVLRPEFELSGYNCIWTDEYSKEWILNVENGVVKSCNSMGGKEGWQLFSISRWNKKDGKMLKHHLEIEFEQKKNRQIYWDDVALFCHSENYKLGIMEMKYGDVIEVDSVTELAALDSNYRIYVDGGEKMENKVVNDKGKKKIDWMITLLPFAMIIVLCILFFCFPKQSNNVLSQIRFVLGDTFGTYYLIIGLGIFLLSGFIALSKYGKIVLGEQDEKPKYSFFMWGSMMFTAGLAADILFYSFSEWILYATDPHIAELGSIQDWASVYPIFHWSLIPWGFYLVLAVAFGFMLHVRKRERQKYSEACRPILGKHTDGLGGRVIDLLAVFALLAGTATTFSLATPLMASIINELFHVQLNRVVITIVILVVTCIIYTYALLHGFKGIGLLAKSCIYLFFALLVYVLLFGGEARYIIETGFSSLGRMIQNFFGLATYTDPGRTTSFPQNWTIFYWAYWMVWCVAAPFFIGRISKGRTVRQTILGGYVFGVGSTIVSFIILGNYSLGKQVSGAADFLGMYQKNGDLYEIIIAIIRTLPGAPFILLSLLITMVTFYATSFDSIALIASCYSYHKLGEKQNPNKLIQLMWCILLILLPIALVFSDSSMSNLQSVSIIAAFPIGAVIVLITASFMKDATKFINGDKGKLTNRNE